MLSCLVWKIRSPHFQVCLLIWSEKSSGSETSKAPYPGAWNFQGVSKGTMYAPFKNIVMLSCLVWKIQSPPFSGICPYMKRKVIGLGNIEGPYPGAWNFQSGSKATIYAPCKNIVMLSLSLWNTYTYIWLHRIPYTWKWGDRIFQTRQDNITIFLQEA